MKEFIIVIAFTFCIYVLSACSSQAASNITPLTVAEDGKSLYILIEGSDTVIDHIDYFLDDATNPFHTEWQAPYEVTLDKSALEPGQHEVRLSIVIDLFNQLSTVERRVSFAVDVLSSKPEPNFQPTPIGAQPTLLKSYKVLKRYTSGLIEWDTNAMTYRPRQGLGGLDTLNTPGGTYLTYTENDWLHLELNRDAQLTVVWNGSSPPSWLSTWAKDGNFYTKGFSAGEVILGAIGGTANYPYTVLLAEADGSPSAPPAVPAGLETPRANEYCPQWVHDQYQAIAPDGNMYATWHAQIDPVYWCYYAHEHGSDPNQFVGDYAPLFGYAAAQMGMDEPHEGWKVFTWSDDNDDWIVTLHAGTGGYGRVCARWHSTDLAVLDHTTGETLADLHHVADYGFSVSVQPGDVFTRLRPDACPENADISDTRGRRNIPTYDNSGYEAWLPDFGPLMYTNDNFSFVQNDPITGCSDANCNTVQPRTAFMGSTFRWFISNINGLNGVFSVDGRTSPGTYYTDAMAMHPLSSSDSGAVKQYLKPGFYSIQGNGHMMSVDPWDRLYISDGVEGNIIHGRLMNLDDAIRPPN